MAGACQWNKAHLSSGKLILVLNSCCIMHFLGGGGREGKRDRKMCTVAAIWWAETEPWTILEKQFVCQQHLQKLIIRLHIVNLKNEKLIMTERQHKCLFLFAEILFIWRAYQSTNSLPNIERKKISDTPCTSTMISILINIKLIHAENSIFFSKREAKENLLILVIWYSGHCLRFCSYKFN